MNSEKSIKERRAEWAKAHRPVPKQKKYKTTNYEFAKEDTEFRSKCEKLGINPTARQASKFRNKKGMVYNNAR